VNKALHKRARLRDAMAQPSQQSFTWHTAAMLGWLSDPELLIAISQNTYDPLIGITASTTIPTTGHCNLSLSRPQPVTKTPLYPGTHEQHTTANIRSSCSSCQPTASRPASTAPRNSIRPSSGSQDVKPLYQWTMALPYARRRD